MRGELVPVSELEEARAELARLEEAEEQGRAVGRAVAALRALEAGPEAAGSDAVHEAAHVLAQMGAETANSEAFAEALWRAGGGYALYGLVSSRDLELSSLGIYAWAAAAGALSPGAGELRRELLPAADIAARVFVALAALEAPPPPKRPTSAGAHGAPRALGHAPASEGRRRLLLAATRVLHAYALDFEEPACLRRPDVHEALRAVAAGTDPAPPAGAPPPPPREAARSLEGVPLLRLLARSALRALRSLPAKHVERAEAGRTGERSLYPPPELEAAGAPWGRPLPSELMVATVGAAGFRPARRSGGGELLRARLAPGPPPPDGAGAPWLLEPPGAPVGLPVQRSPFRPAPPPPSAAAPSTPLAGPGRPAARAAGPGAGAAGVGGAGGGRAAGAARVGSTRLANTLRRLQGGAGGPAPSPLWRTTE
eukprot:tig00000123_g6932.t1